MHRIYGNDYFCGCFYAEGTTAGYPGACDEPDWFVARDQQGRRERHDVPTSLVKKWHEVEDYREHGSEMMIGIAIRSDTPTRRVV